MNLLNLMGVDYKWSRRALYISLLCGIGVYVVVLKDTLSEHSNSSRLALIAFFFQFLALLLRYLSSHRFSKAEEIRRLAVMQDALDIEPSPNTIANIVARIGVSTPIKAHLGKYFTSDKPAGISRLLEHIEESAFWTYHIASFTGIAGLFAVIVGAIISVVALIGFVNAGASPSALHSAAEAVVVTLSFVVAGDFLVLSLDYCQLSKESCCRMKEAAAQLEAGKYDRDSAIILFGEYNCNLSGASPLPSFIYRLRHKGLSRAWAAREARVPVE